MSSENLFEEYSQMWMVQKFMEENSDKFRYIPDFGWMINKDVMWIPDTNEIVVKKISNLVETNLIEVNKKIIDAQALSKGSIISDKDLKHFLTIIKKNLGIVSLMSKVGYLISIEQGLKRLLTISSDNFNLDITSINLKNGIFNLETLTLRDRNSKDYNRFVCNFEYNSESTCPTWNEIIKTILPEKDQQEYIQKFYGYCLSGHTNEEKFVIFTGKGGNGKSTLIVTPAKMLSGYSKLAPTEAFTTNNNNNDVRRAGFEGARYVYCEEIQKYYTLNTEFVKTFASYGTLISARHMRGEPYQYTNTSKFVISANFPPQIKDTGDSIKRRLVIIPFKCKVLETELKRFKGDLDKRLESEYSGIFNWMVEGYRKWKVEGLEIPESLMKYQMEYLESNELLHEFISEMIKLQDNQTLTDDNKNTIRKSDVYDGYRKWCIYRHEDKPIQKHVFYEELIQSLQRRDPTISLSKRSDAYYFKGITIKELPEPKIKQGGY